MTFKLAQITEALNSMGDREVAPHVNMFDGSDSERPPLASRASKTFALDGGAVPRPALTIGTISTGYMYRGEHWVVTGEVELHTEYSLTTRTARLDYRLRQMSNRSRRVTFHSWGVRDMAPGQRQAALEALAAALGEALGVGQLPAGEPVSVPKSAVIEAAVNAALTEGGERMGRGLLYTRNGGEERARTLRWEAYRQAEIALGRQRTTLPNRVLGVEITDADVERVAAKAITRVRRTLRETAAAL